MPSGRNSIIAGEMLRRLLAALLLLTGSAACSRPADEAAPVATPAIALATAAVPIESPVDVTYTFQVAPNAPPLTQNYRVFVHFNDASGQQLWTDDHQPVPPATAWKPGATIRYTHTMFVPKVPYTGETTIDMGLYLPGTDERVPLTGTAVGKRAYRVGTLQVQPQMSTALVLFNEGWYQAEVVPDSPGVEWRWSKQQATLRFRNPNRDITFMLDLDQPQADLTAPQQLQLRAGATTLDSFTLTPGERTVRRVDIPMATLGGSDTVELTLTVDPTFTPAYLPAAKNKDVRTLGVRVFHTFIQPN
jgi:hypothetical protein